MKNLELKDLTIRAQKWVEIYNKGSDIMKLRDKYESGYYYNPIKAAKEDKNLVKNEQMLERIQKKLTTKEKSDIEDYFQCGLFES